ncbi:FCD domain-containing protein, partial [Oscillibacter sp. CAG:155]
LNAIQDDLEQYLCSGENDVEVIAKKDIAFHQELASATDNVAVITTYDSIVKITEDFLYKTIETILQHDAVAYFSESHRGIMEKLAGNNLDELFRRVEWSYKYWYMTFQEEDSSKSGDSQQA